MNQITILLSCIFLLISCGKPGVNELGETSTGVLEKQDFFIVTKQLEDFSNKYEIKKVGILSSTQSVKLSSNASGRISTLRVKEGDTVKSGQLIATLADNIGNYDINVDKANNAIARAKINYDAQKISLDKQIADAELQLGKLGKNLVNLQKTNSQNIARSQNDQDNINAAENIEKLNLNVEKLNQNIVKLEQNIENLKFDLENQKLGNDETLSGFRSRILTEQTSLRLSLDDIIEFADEILGVTPENEDENEDFDQYLGAKDKVQRGVSETSLRTLITFRNGEFENFVPDTLSDMTDEQILGAIVTGERGYELTKILLRNLEVTFQNSIPSIGSLSTQQIDTFGSQIDSFQSSTQGSYTGFIGLKSQIESFVRTYENSEESTAKQIALLENDIILLEKDKQILINDRDLQGKNLDTAQKNAEIGIDSITTQGNDAIVNLENQIESTQLSLQNAKANRTITLKSLDNQIAEANINYSLAVKERAKLSVYAPISGTISTVSVDVGEEVNSGVEILNIQNTSNTEIIIGLSNDELDLIETGLKVSVIYDGTKVGAKIFSVSDIADENLNFKTIIELDKPIKRLGKLVEVYIPVTTKNILVPLNIVEINANGTEGILDIYTEKGIIEALGVQIGNTYGANIEITACANPQILSEEDSEVTEKFITCSVFEKAEVITSNMNNYDESKFKILVK